MAGSGSPILKIQNAFWKFFQKSIGENAVVVFVVLRRNQIESSDLCSCPFLISGFYGPESDTKPRV